MCGCLFSLREELEFILKVFLKYHKKAVSLLEKGYTMGRREDEEEGRGKFDGAGEEGRRNSGTKN